MQEKERLAKHIGYARARNRNLIYYWGLEQTDPMRFSRKQYMHALREHRKVCLDLLSKLGSSWDNEDDVRFLDGIVKTIDPAVRKEDCEDTIERLEEWQDRGTLTPYTPRPKVVERKKQSSPAHKSRPKKLGGVNLNHVMRDVKGSGKEGSKV